jgi:hypothetical protein
MNSRRAIEPPRRASRTGPLCSALWRTASIIGILTASGCDTGPLSEEDVEDVEDTAPTEASRQALAYWTDPKAPIQCTTGGSTVTQWTAGGTVDICFTGDQDSAAQNLVRTAITQSWGAVANLSFRWNGTCPTTINGDWVSIFLRVLTDGNFGGNGAPGKRNRLISSASDCVNDNGSDRAAGWNNRTDVQMHAAGGGARLQAVAVHEFGHVLGYYHEHDRNDSFHDTARCASEAGTAGGGLLTIYDAQSVMSYCAEAYGRPVDDWVLSPLDRLGTEIMYPFSVTNHKIGCKTGCVTDGSGGAIVRDSGALTSDWRQRGGINIIPTWTFGTSTASGSNLNASSLTASTQLVNYRFSDARQRTNTGSGTVRRSNRLHTAVVEAAFGALL